MKLLKCSIHDQGYWEVTSDLEPKYKGNRYPIIHLPISEIWASVPRADKHRGKPFYKPLKEDIEKHGLRWPIMVIKSTRKELQFQKAKWGKAINPLPFWLGEDMNATQYVVWGGSNRLYAAKELGYDHIDCAIIPTYNDAHRLQKTMREEYVSKFYTTKTKK